MQQSTDKKSIHTYSIEKQADGAYFLDKDGLICTCPKSAVAIPVPVASQFEAHRGMQIVPQKFPCSTVCPHATIKKDDNGDHYYVISCEGKEIEFKVEVMKPSN